MGRVGQNTRQRQPAPLVAHLVHRLDYGGLENGVVNLVNTMDPRACRHAIIALTEVTGFADRIRNPEATVHAIGKRPGKDPRAYFRLWRLLRRLRPAILHTRNIGTLDCTIVGRLAGIPVRLHGEHGWDVHDPDGTNPRYRQLRRWLDPLVTRFITVSRDLGTWLVEVVGIRREKVMTICNGVDTGRFRPCDGGRELLPPGFAPPGSVIVGSVTRFQDIKDPLLLVRAFIRAVSATADTFALRLVMLGDGPLRNSAEALLADAGLTESAWLPGMRDDVPELMRSFDLFVLSSRREGISNTILEALASGLPVVATRTGGNPELVDEGVTGTFIEPGADEELAVAIVDYAADEPLRRRQGRAARQQAEERFSLTAMAAAYRAVYAAALSRAGS